MIDAVSAADASPRARSRAAQSPSAELDFASLIPKAPRGDIPETQETGLIEREAEPRRGRDAPAPEETAAATPVRQRERAAAPERPARSRDPARPRPEAEAADPTIAEAGAVTDEAAVAPIEPSRKDASDSETTPDTAPAAAPAPPAATPQPAPAATAGLLIALLAGDGQEQPVAAPAEIELAVPAATGAPAPAPQAPGAEITASPSAAVAPAATAETTPIATPAPTTAIAVAEASADGSDPAATPDIAAAAPKPRALPGFEPGTPPPQAGGAHMPAQAEERTAQAAVALAAAPGQQDEASEPSEQPPEVPVEPAPRGPAPAAIAASHVQAERAAAPTPSPADIVSGAVPVAEAALRPAGHAAPQGAPTTAGQVATREAVPIERVAFEIAATARAGVREIEIKLDPPELGRIDVSLDVDEAGRVTTRLVVEKAETLAELRRDAPALEKALAGAGLKTDSGSLQFSLRGEGQGREDQPRDDRPSARGTLLVEASEINSWRAPDRARLAAARGGVDVRI